MPPKTKKPSKIVGGVFVGPIPNENEYKKKLEKDFIASKGPEPIDDDILDTVNTNNPSSFITFARGKSIGLLTKKSLKGLLKSNNPADPVTRQPFHDDIINLKLESRETYRDVVALSASGSLLAYAFRDTSVIVKDFNSNNEVRKFEVEGQVISLAISYDGELLAVAIIPDETEDEDTNCELLLFSISSGRLNYKTTASEIIERIRFSPNNDSLVTMLDNTPSDKPKQAAEFYEVRVSAAETGARAPVTLKKIKQSGKSSYAGQYVLDVAYSPDGKKFACVSVSDDKKEKVLKLWTLMNGSVTTITKRTEHELCSVAFSPDGTIIATGDTDDTVWLWRLENTPVEQLVTVSSHTLHSDLKKQENLEPDEDYDGVSALAFSPDGKQIASVNLHHIIVWSIENPSIKTVIPHGYWIDDEDSVKWNVHQIKELFFISKERLITVAPFSHVDSDSVNKDSVVQLWDIGEFMGGSKQKQPHNIRVKYKGHSYVVRTGARGGSYILVGKEKRKLYV